MGSVINIRNISILLAVIIVVLLIKVLAIVSLQTMSIIIVIMIVAFLIGALTSMNKQLKERIMIEKKKSEYYDDELSRIRKIKDIKKEIEEINNLARDFFKKRLDLKESLTYLELAKEFKKQNKENHEEFCILMANLLYSGIKIKQENINQAIKLFQRIINA